MVITALTPAHRIVCSVGETAHRSTCLTVLEDNGSDMGFRAASVLLPCAGVVVLGIPSLPLPSTPLALYQLF